jgi:filamentous hemagglutinin family protein
MEDGVQVVARLVASGSTVTGKGRAYAPTLNGQPTNFQFPNGLKVMDVAINGTLGAGTFSGTQTYGTFNLAFSFTLNAQQTTAPASLAKIAGTYVASTAGNRVFIGHIEPNGRMWGSGPAFAYSGLVQVIDPDLNIYRVTLAYLKNSTFGYVSGLATFHDTSPVIFALPMPTAIVPAGYTADVGNLTYTQSADGNSGMLAMLLSSPLQQISLEAVRVSSLQQTIAARPAPTSLMVQAVGNPAFSVRAAGDIQYSGSAETIAFSGFIGSSSGAVNIVSNPGMVTLNGPGDLAIPLPRAIASTIAMPVANLVVGQLPANSVISWQSFNITPNQSINFVASSGAPTLNRVTVSAGQILGSLQSNAQVSVLDPNGAVLVGGELTLNGSVAMPGTALVAGGVSISMTGATANLLTATTSITLTATVGSTLTASAGTYFLDGSTGAHGMTIASAVATSISSGGTNNINVSTSPITIGIVGGQTAVTTVTSSNGPSVAGGDGNTNTTGTASSPFVAWNCASCVSLSPALTGASIDIGRDAGIYGAKGIAFNGNGASSNSNSMLFGTYRSANGSTGTNTILQTSSVGTIVLSGTSVGPPPTSAVVSNAAVHSGTTSLIITSSNTSSGGT